MLPGRKEHQMNNNNNYINTNIYDADPLATLFESSTDSAAAPEEHQVPAQTVTQGTARGQQQVQQARQQDNAVPELMKQLLDLSQSELQHTAADNASGLAQFMREAYNAHENPALYPQTPPPGEQPPPIACLVVIQAWRAQLARHTQQERTLGERLGMTATTANQISHHKRPWEQEGEEQHGAPAPKQRRLPIVGILNPHTAKRNTELLDNDVARVAAQHEDEENILAPKEKPLPHVYMGNGQRDFHQPPGTRLLRK